MRVVCDTNLEACDSRNNLEAFQRSVVEKRALMWTSKGTIVGMLPDDCTSILAEMNRFTISCRCDVTGMMDKEVDPNLSDLGSMSVV